jgi:hypothetical protein
VPATCEEVSCQHYLNGWHSAIDESTDLGQRQAHYIRKQSGRGFAEYPGREWNGKMIDALTAANRPLSDFEPVGDNITVFEFKPGQACFQSDSHMKPQAYNPLYLVGGCEGLIRRHTSGDSWADDLRTHQEAVVRDYDLD